MKGLLAPGEQVRLVPGDAGAEVVAKLNEGGFGEIYEVRAADGSALALKWFYPRTSVEERRPALRRLVDLGPPSPNFVWPLALAEIDGIPAFGYVMPLIGDDYANLAQVLRGDGEVEPSLRSMAAAGHRLASGLLLLHTRGLCYRDINFGNVVIDPRDGDILICDNDNVGVDHGQDVGVAGTPRFMAPEVARGEALPSTRTDLYSLAVLLFYLLHSHHPLHGRRERELAPDVWDGAAENAMFVTDPLFVFDPDDDSNRPLPGEHDGVIASWRLLPGFVRELFLQAFTVGLHDPDQRVGEMQWRDAMLALRDLVVVCAGCGAQWFLDPEDPDGSAAAACWNCGQVAELPLRLRLPRGDVALTDVTELNPHHLEPAHRHDVSAVLGVTVRRDTDGMLGLRNETDRQWIASRPGSSGAFLAPGRTLGLVEGSRIQFGAVEAEVVR